MMQLVEKSYDCLYPNCKGSESREQNKRIYSFFAEAHPTFFIRKDGKGSDELLSKRKKPRAKQKNCADFCFYDPQRGIQRHASYHFVCSTRPLYSEYMGFVLRVHDSCTESTWALYSTLFAFTAPPVVLFSAAIPLYWQRKTAGTFSVAAVI